MKKHYQTPTLEEKYGSTSKFLTATKDEHGGLDADTLIKYWNWGTKPNMSVSSLALIAGVSWQTMDKWLDRLHDEVSIERPRPKRATE